VIVKASVDIAKTKKNRPRIETCTTLPP